MQLTCRQPAPGLARIPGIVRTGPGPARQRRPGPPGSLPALARRNRLMYRSLPASLRQTARRVPGLARLWLAAALTVPVIPLIALAPASPAPAPAHGPAAQPPMGWNDWNAYGCNVSEQLVEQPALAMNNDGPQAAGRQEGKLHD